MWFQIATSVRLFFVFWFLTGEPVGQTFAKVKVKSEVIPVGSHTRSDAFYARCS